MNYKNFSVIIILFSIFLYMACKPALYIPTRKDESISASYPELIQGRKIYVQKCSGCHNLVLPEKHNLTEWQYWLGKMEVKVALNEQDKTLILKYLSKGK